MPYNSRIYSSHLGFEFAIAGSATASGVTSRDALLTGLAADIDTRLPTTFDIEAVRYKYPVDYNESMNTGLLSAPLAALWTSLFVALAPT